MSEHEKESSGGEGDRADETDPPVTKREPSVPPPPLVPPEEGRGGPTVFIFEDLPAELPEVDEEALAADIVDTDPNEGVEPSEGDVVIAHGDSEPVATGYAVVPPDDDLLNKSIPCG